MIELVSVSKSYREGNSKRQVFHSLDAQFPSSEFVCITGRSGTGKSTLLNLIGGIDVPDQGEVLIDGRNISSLSDRERTLARRRNIGFVFQFFNLVPTLTVEENLRLPLELNGTGDNDGTIERLLEQIGLGGRAHSYPENLSGGEQQRVAIARALVHAPGIVLADEPTGNLDQDTGRAVLELMTGMVRDAGATLLMVSHSAEAARWADRIFHIEKGVLIPVEPAD